VQEPSQSVQGGEGAGKAQAAAAAAEVPLPPPLPPTDQNHVNTGVITGQVCKLFMTGAANITEDVVVQLVESPTLPFAQNHTTSDVLIDSVHGNCIPTAVRGLTSQVVITQLTRVVAG
jgi:hypothetical protein